MSRCAQCLAKSDRCCVLQLPGLISAVLPCFGHACGGLCSNGWLGWARRWQLHASKCVPANRGCVPLRLLIVVVVLLCRAAWPLHWCRCVSVGLQQLLNLVIAVLVDRALGLGRKVEHVGIKVVSFVLVSAGLMLSTL